MSDPQRLDASRLTPGWARIVELAREYKEACAQHQDAQQALWQVRRPDAAGRELLMHAEQRAWDAIKHRRAALFRALSELEELEEREDGPAAGVSFP